VPANDWLVFLGVNFFFRDQARFDVFSAVVAYELYFQDAVVALDYSEWQIYFSSCQPFSFASRYSMYSFMVWLVFWAPLRMS